MLSMRIGLAYSPHLHGIQTTTENLFLLRLCRRNEFRSTLKNAQKLLQEIDLVMTMKGLNEWSPKGAPLEFTKQFNVSDIEFCN